MLSGNMSGCMYSLILVSSANTTLLVVTGLNLHTTQKSQNHVCINVSDGYNETTTTTQTSLPKPL